MAVGDFPIDPNVPQTYGPPADGAERRCQGKLRGFANPRRGEQCRKWALRGSRFCKTHGGTFTKNRKSQGRLKNFYSRFATGKLKDLIDQAANDDERASLAGEVDTARALCSEAITVVSKVMDPPEGVKLSDELKFGAMSIAQNSLEHVGKLVEKMVKVMALSESTFNHEQVDYICDKIIGILLIELEGEDEKFQRIVEAIKDVRVVPKANVQINIT